MSAPPRDSEEGSLPFRDGEIVAGKYEVDRVLGQGGMGVVVAAHHIALQQKVAIKVMLPGAMEIPGAAQRFLREARSAVAIQSEHVARVLDVGTLDGGAPFMVMEFLTGSDLGAVLRRSGRLSIGVAIDHVLQASEAIAEAHSLGIVHRDLKPDNIFLTRRADGSALVKVLDFGLSKPTKDDGMGAATPSLTATNMIAGSPQYMSPEQVRGLKNADHRADIWALGVILFELTTGQRPFDAETVAGVFAKIAADAPTLPRALRPEMPAALEAVILRCLEKDVSRRVQDVAELAEGLLPFAPAEARTSVERIVRLVGGGRGAGAAGGAGVATLAAVAAPAPIDTSGADSMEADLSGPTGTAAGYAPMPAPMYAPMPAAPTYAPMPAAPTYAPMQAAPTYVATRAPGPAPTPPRRAPEPAARMDLDFGTSRSRAPHASPELDIDVVRPVHPVDRGRSPVRDEPRPTVRVADLGLGTPIRILLVAIVIAAADMVVVRVLGQTLALGPVRPLWVAGPLALVGAVWLVSRLVQR